ncbi:hypothetical protein ARMGADRAFT_1089127 [Armillaria gallica]|uniref:Uncharacterized protein n=1 Tax=Armillaria gallica TaxID=47427 RepID=A0A2H3CP94_ARMGA|nr:hypothetical protein ARMGADRAFT_1089127 [Armillaria gallica]
MRESYFTWRRQIYPSPEDQDLTSANYAESESSPDPLAPILGAAVVDETNISGSPEVPDQRADDISASVYETDDVQTVYHPASGIPTRVEHFEQYRSDPTFQYTNPPIDPCPWQPFDTHRDFKLGEFILDAALTNKQMNTLFELLTPQSESIQGLESTIKSPKDFKEHWDRAANHITPLLYPFVAKTRHLMFIDGIYGCGR